MRTILKTFYSAVLVLAYTATFSSCNNVELEQDAQTENCVVRLSVSQDSSRTAMPEGLKLAELAYTLTAENDSELLALSSPWNWSSQSEMQSAELLLDAGFWSFTLTAQKDGKNVLTGTASAEITTGTNSIAFTLAPPLSGTGSLNMSLTDITGVGTVSATLCNLSGTALTAADMGSAYDTESDGALTQNWTWTESEPAVSATALFDLNHVPKGSYMLIWTLNVGTSSRKLRPVAVVEPGRVSSETYSLNTDNAETPKFYSVTYNDGVEGEEIEVPVDLALYTYNSTVTVKPAIERANYNFTGWQDLQAGSSYNPDSNATFVMPERSVTLTAGWQAKEGVKFKVEHYKQILSASTEEYTETNYELAYTDNLQGTAGQNTTAASKGYTGFTDGFTVNENGIADDGIVQQQIYDYGENESDCTVVKVYYKRNMHTVTYRGLADGESAGEGEEITVPDSVTVRYEATVNINFAPARTGYRFLKWVKDDADKTEYLVGAGTYTFTMYDNDVVLTAVWAANTDTSYTVEHYKQNLDAADVFNPDDYTLADTEHLTGETASRINVTSKDYTGFTMKEASESYNIRADGATTVKVYYQRDTHTVTYNANFTGATISVPADNASYRYEAPVSVLFTNTASASMSTIGLRPGFTFLGWSTDNLAEEPMYTSDGLASFNMGDDYVTLYAVWRANTVSGGNITVNPPVYTDVDLGLSYTVPASGTVTFTVSGGYASYCWFVDGAVAALADVTEDNQTDTKSFRWNYSQLEDDGYNIMLVVTDAEGHMYTATTYVVITK